MRIRWLAAAVAVVCVTIADAAESQDRPNILLIVADDQRPDTVHALGNALIRTPSLDRLVREGTAFTRAVTAIPICVASRAELLTGRDGLQNGRSNYGFSPAGAVPGIADVLREAGYETCYTGKWHTAGRPGTWGYSECAGLYAGGGRSLPLTHPADCAGRPVTGYVGWLFQTDDRQLFPERGVGFTPEISEEFADAALEFIQSPRERPFFLHVNFTAPHDPLLMPPGDEFRYDAAAMPLPRNYMAEHPFDHGNRSGRDELLFATPRTEEETRGELTVYYSVISHMDAQIGRLLDELERSGQLEKTVVIYTSDHGLAIGSHGLRGKQNMYEHTIGVPLLVRGPGIPAGRRTDAQCYLRDLFPTICELAGVGIPDSVQGRSLAAVLRGEQQQVYGAVFTHFLKVQRAIRTDEWKYIVYPEAERAQLFRLTDDPDELADLSGEAEHAAILSALRSRLRAWRRSWDDPLLAE